MNELPTRRYKNLSLGRKLEVKNRTGWANLERCSTDVSIEISMQNGDCSGQSLALILEWVGDGWNSITLSVGDALHRYNIFVVERAHNPSFTMLDADQKATQLGDEWLVKNLTLLQMANLQSRVVRWSDWLSHPQFETILAKYVDYYDSEQEFRDAIATDIHAHNARRGFSGKDAVEFQAQYILEEVAVYHLQNVKMPCIHIYPGSKLKTLQYLETSKNPSIKLNRHYAYVQVSENI